MNISRAEFQNLDFSTTQRKFQQEGGVGVVNLKEKTSLSNKLATENQINCGAKHFPWHFINSIRKHMHKCGLKRKAK